MFDINNFVIDRVIRGVMTSTADGSLMYSINQIEDPSISCTAEEKEAVDAIGTTIATYQRAKKAEVSGSNSLFDLGLLASQVGSDKNIASTTNKIIVPMFETIDVTGTTATLSKKPMEDITAIYELKGDSTMGTKYEVSTSATADKFAYDSVTYTITLPTDVAVGSQIFVMYDYESEEAVEVVNSATQYPKAGKFVMEVLGNDVCDPTTLIYAYLIFPNAKLDANVDITLSTDGKHPFTLKCQQEYCDKEKKLFSIVIPNLD